MTKTLGFVFHAGEQEVLLAVGETLPGKPTWAEGMRRLMSAFAYSQMDAAGVAIGAFLDVSDQSVLRLFASYRQAVRGTDGWRLATLPPGGHWEGRGVAGKVYPLHETQKFTTNGIETYTGSRPLPVNFLRDDWQPGH